MTLPNYPSPAVKAFGEKVNAAMYDASILPTGPKVGRSLNAKASG